MKKLSLTLILITILALCIGLIVFAEAEPVSADESTVTMPTVFADGMVLQRREPINVFGYCETDGAVIEVTLGENTVSATVENGEWLATLPEMEAAKGLTLTVTQKNTASGEPLVFNNVSVGEVWVVGGQSNAVYEFNKMDGREEYLLNADNFDNIHVFTTTKTPAPTADNLLYGDGKWFKVDYDFLSSAGTGAAYNISSVGYVMATRLAAELGSDVPIAIMNLCVSGSSIKTWISPEVYQNKNDFYTSSARLAFYNDYLSYLKHMEFYKQNGRWPNSTAELTGYLSTSSLPSCHYDSFIGPYTGYTAKGAVWYQGESDLDMGDMYIDYFDAVKSSFKTTFANDDMSFFVVSLQPYGTSSSTFNSMSNFREVQYKMASLDENTYLVSAQREGATFTTEDLSFNPTTPGYAHNARKAPVGVKLADEVLRKIYGIGESFGAPTILDVAVLGNQVILAFDTDISLYFGDKPVGFEIASSNNNFYEATATLNGNIITLTASGVSSPKQVRYGHIGVYTEHESGLMIDFSCSSEETSTRPLVEYVTRTVGGATYYFVRDSHTALNSSIYGNVTNAYGHPLPAFKITLQ